MKTLLTIGVIIGMVVDSETKEPLTGVRVETISEDGVSYTDLGGFYTIESKDKIVGLKLSYISYRDTIISVNDMKDGLIELESR
jgi:hypothetical protein